MHLNLNTKDMIDWSLLEGEFYSPADGILQVNRSRTSVFTLQNYVIFKSDPKKNICDIIMSKPLEKYSNRLVLTLER